MFDIGQNLRIGAAAIGGSWSLFGLISLISLFLLAILLLIISL